MRSASRTTKAVLVLAAVTAAALVAIPVAIAAFGSTTQNGGDFVTAAPDLTPPAIGETVVAKASGGTPGFVRTTGTYYLYANVAADTGNPASGLAGVKANLTELTAGQGEAVLTAGSYSVGGTSYNFRSAELTVTAAVEGARSYTVTATDKAGNARTLAGTVTVDNLPPTAADVQTANGGSKVGLAEEKDSITYTFSEPIEPGSILTNWTGAATNVVVRIADNGLLGLVGGKDELSIYNATNTAALPLGTVNLGRNDYVNGVLGRSIFFGATGTKSTMTMTGNTVTVTFGTESPELAGVGPTTAGGSGTMIWTPETNPYDRAGNAMSATPATESGAADPEF